MEKLSFGGVGRVLGMSRCSQWKSDAEESPSPENGLKSSETTTIQQQQAGSQSADSPACSSALAKRSENKDEIRSEKIKLFI